MHNLSYWEQGVKSPLLHTWSICIELQFYILWPFIIKFILKKFKNNKLKLRKILVFISCLILISFLFTILLSKKNDFNYLYYNSISRISSFLIGGFISFLSFGKAKTTNNLIINKILILILILISSLFKINDLNLFRGIILIYCILFGLLIYLCNITKFKLVNVLFENKFILYIGRISYSFYLVHLPVIVFLSPENLLNWFKIDLFNKDYLLAIIHFIVSIFLSIILHYLVEKRLKFKNIKSVIIVIILFPLLTLFIINNSTLFINNKSTNSIIDEKWIDSDPIVSEGNDPILVIGDSWARRIGMGLTYIEKDFPENKTQSILTYGVYNSSIMNPDYFIKWDTEEKMYPKKSFDQYLNYCQEAIDKYSPQTVIIVFGNADQCLEVINGKELRVGEKEFDEIFKKQYQLLIEFFKKNNINNIYITNVINNAHDEKDILLNEYSNYMNKNINEIIACNKDTVKLLDINKFLSNNVENLSPYIINGTVVYDETNHTSLEGSIMLANWILSQINDSKK